MGKKIAAMGLAALLSVMPVANSFGETLHHYYQAIASVYHDATKIIRNGMNNNTSEVTVEDEINGAFAHNFQDPRFALLPGRAFMNMPGMSVKFGYDPSGELTSVTVRRVNAPDPVEYSGKNIPKVFSDAFPKIFSNEMGEVDSTLVNILKDNPNLVQFYQPFSGKDGELSFRYGNMNYKLQKKDGAYNFRVFQGAFEKINGYPNSNVVWLADVKNGEFGHNALSALATTVDAIEQNNVKKELSDSMAPYGFSLN